MIKKLSLLFAALFLASTLAISGCQFLPPLPTIGQTTATEVPASLTEAANRILPSTVIVDTRYATGTGWILDSNGIVVTNYHVIQDARSVVITLYDGRRLSVTSIASDPIGDLAILRVNASDLPAAKVGTSASLRIGDPVVAVGNSLGEGISVKNGQVTQLNVTVGIEDAQYYGLIENNAPIQEGDSGGPLVNKSGEVIGISNAKVIGLEDIAYAINIDSAMPLLQQLITKGSVDRGYLGIKGQNNPNGNGVLIVEINPPGGPADIAGLRVGDIILELNGENVSGIEALTQTIRSFKVGQSITITYRRGSSQASTVATLIQYPAL